MRRPGRPALRVEIGNLGVVDPFRLRVVQHPPSSGRYFAEDPKGRGRIDLEAAGLNLVGASQALLGLSVRWLSESGREVAECAPGPGGLPELPAGEVRVALRRREARLLASLLRRHLGRLPEPPGWMPELQHALEQIDSFLQWEEG